MKNRFNLSDKTQKILDNALDEAITVEDAIYLMNLKGSEVFPLLETADYLR